MSKRRENFKSMLDIAVNSAAKMPGGPERISSIRIIEDTGPKTPGERKVRARYDYMTTLQDVLRITYPDIIVLARPNIKNGQEVLVLTLKRHEKRDITFSVYERDLSDMEQFVKNVLLVLSG